MDTIEQLRKIITESTNMVFFGGAGVSTESGIPDFRSVDGLYSREYKYPPQQILSHSFYCRHTEEFFRFYRAKMLNLDARPNAAHEKLAKWEQEGRIRAIVTQNIDGLHQAAGSKAVWELHGSVLRNYCEECGKFHDVSHMQSGSLIPVCTKCGGRIKPDVVLYEESLNQDVIAKAVDAISKADVLIIGGTSLAVYPAAGLIDYFKGSRLVVVNADLTSRDSGADLVVRGRIGEVFSTI